MTWRSPWDGDVSRQLRRRIRLANAELADVAEVLALPQRRGKLVDQSGAELVAQVEVSTASTPIEGRKFAHCGPAELAAGATRSSAA